MTDFAIARANMVENQVRPNGVTDRRLIAAMAEVPREIFVPESLRGVAYMDEDIPLKRGRRLIEPMALGRLIDLAAVTPSDHVLEIGCATGYGTALLAQLAGRVTAIDEDAELAELARANMTRIGAASVAVSQAAHAGGAPAAAPFDVILIEGRIPEIPKALFAQLKEGGRLVAVVGTSGVTRAVICSKAGSALSRRSAFDASVAALPGFVTPAPAFVF